MMLDLQDNVATPKKRTLWQKIRLVLWLLFFLLIAIVLTVYLMARSDKGSKRLLDWVMARQHMVQYQYVGGNLVQGLQLRDIVVKAKDTEVQVKNTDVRLGWRAVLKRELHFTTAKIGQVDIINKAKPSNSPFSYPELKLPFNLILDDAKINQLNIKSPYRDHVVKMEQIQIYDGVWKDTKIALKKSSISLYGIDAKNINGSIEFNKKYPVNVSGEVYIAALKNLKLDKIAVSGKGDLENLALGVASQTPDLITGSVMIHPFSDYVPMEGKINWADFNVPILTEQKLYAEAGNLIVRGNVNGLELILDTALKTEKIPQGTYQAAMFTDFKNLRIDESLIRVLDGEMNVKGNVNWQDGVKWQATADVHEIKPTEQLLSSQIRGFLPDNLTAKVSSEGVYDVNTDLNVKVDFANNEKWFADIQQDRKHAKTWNIATTWQDVNRAMPYIGWLDSQHGQAEIQLFSGQKQWIKANADVRKHEQSPLPTGKYTADLEITPQKLLVHQFILQQAQQGQLAVQGNVVIPNEKQALAVNAQIQADEFNPHILLPQAPVQRLNGQFNLNAHQKDNQYIANLTDIRLQGKLASSQEKNQNIALTGLSTLVAIMHPAPQSGLKSFAVRYDGQLNAENYTQGPLRLNIAGTPEYLDIGEFYHQGVAGLIQAKGKVNLVEGLKWDLQAHLDQFKPHYFVAQAEGDLTGQLETTGQWSEQQKNIHVQKLNMRGKVLGKPLLAQGEVNIHLTQDQQNKIIPKQFHANNFLLSYANNVVQANGNAQQLLLNVSANKLSEVHQDLTGHIKGVVALSTQPNLTASANLIGENVAFQDQLKIENLRLYGRLPLEQQATQMQLDVQNLKSGERGLDQLNVVISGTRQAHVLKMEGKSELSQVRAQLAGGLTEQFDWLGQLQKGEFLSKRTSLQQRQHANLVYRHAQRQLALAPHCWIGQQNQNSQICLDQPLLADPKQGVVSTQVKNVELADFAAFMPTDLAIKGMLNGYAKLSWQDQQPMQFESRLITQNGSIGLASDDTEENLSKLDYKEMRIDAKTLREGLSLKINADTPLLGAGFANLLIGTQPTQKSLSGEVAFNEMQMAILRPFLSDVRILEGKLSAAGRVSGTLQQPLFNGEVRLKDGHFALMSAPVHLQNIQLASSIRGNQADIRGAFNAGQGQGKITGQATWANQPQIRLKIEGQELLVAQPPSISAAVSPAIDLDIRPAQKQLVVSGEVNIPRALITMPESSPNVVANSADLRIVRSDQVAKVVERTRPWQIRTNVDVHLGTGVIFRGFNSTIPLAGSLSLTQRGTQMNLQANGAIGTSRQVKIEAYGQSLDLKRAIARFGGQLSNPALDIDANKNVQNALIGLRVTGSANRPNIVIYNDAGLSEQQALNALLTGNIADGTNANAESFKSDVNNTIAAAGISMGLGTTRALTNQIGRSLGLSGLALDAQGAGNDTQVSVTGYITPDLYVRYGVGVFTPVTKLTLRYQINRRLYLEASSSVERAVDLFYNWRF